MVVKFRANLEVGGSQLCPSDHLAITGLEAANTSNLEQVSIPRAHNRYCRRLKRQRADPRQATNQVRIAFIDAPQKGQAFGQAAKGAMSELVFDKDVELRFMPIGAELTSSARPSATCRHCQRNFIPRRTD